MSKQNTKEQGVAFKFPPETGHTDKELYPAFDPDDQAKRIDTCFASDFAIAERFGMEAVEDTYKRASAEWRSNIQYMVELVAVLNHRCWKYHNIYTKAQELIKQAGEDDMAALAAFAGYAMTLSKFYSDKYYLERDHVLGSDKFTDAEKSLFASILD